MTPEMRGTPTTSNEIGLFSSPTDEEGTAANKMNETSVEARSKEGKEKTTQNTPAGAGVTTTSDTGKEDKKVQDDTADLKTQVEKLDWQKTNFDAFDGKKVKGITSTYI